MRAVLVPHSAIPDNQKGHVEGDPDAVVDRLADLLAVVDGWTQLSRCRVWRRRSCSAWPRRSPAGSTRSPAAAGSCSCRRCCWPCPAPRPRPGAGHQQARVASAAPRWPRRPTSAGCTRTCAPPCRWPPSRSSAPPRERCAPRWCRARSSGRSCWSLLVAVAVWTVARPGVGPGAAAAVRRPPAPRGRRGGGRRHRLLRRHLRAGHRRLPGRRARRPARLRVPAGLGDGPDRQPRHQHRRAARLHPAGRADDGGSAWRWGRATSAGAWLGAHTAIRRGSAFVRVVFLCVVAGPGAAPRATTSSRGD